MRPPASLLLVWALSVIYAGCSGSNPKAPDPVEITGSERLGWDQPASDGEELANLTFFVAVDGVRSVMPDVQCDKTPPSQVFACSGRLPAMTAGRHSIQLSTAGPGGVESALSPALLVNVSARSVSLGAASTSSSRRFTTSDRIRLGLTPVVDGLDDPTDLASLPDGGALVSERRGEIQEVRVEGPDAGRMRSVLTVPDVDATRQGGLLSLAADPAFDRNGYVYVVYTAADGFRVARFRNTGERLEERVVLLDRVSPVSALPAAVIRFGPDDKLYVAFDDGGDARRAGDWGSYNGKVLRLNADATTPEDQETGTPVSVVDVNAPYGLSWTTSNGPNGPNGPLWIVQAGPDASSPTGAGELRAIVHDRPGRRGRVALRFVLPAGTRATGLVAYRGSLMHGFDNDLFVAAEQGVLRIRLDPADPLKVVSSEHLFEDAKMAARAVSVGRDGALYLATASALLRMAPDTDRE